MAGLPLDVWAVMLFSILVFFGVSIWVLIYTLREEERKIDILTSEDTIDTHSPRALRDLREWIEANPEDPDLDDAKATYRECVDALQSTDRHFYNWSDEEIADLDSV